MGDNGDNVTPCQTMLKLVIYRIRCKEALGLPFLITNVRAHYEYDGEYPDRTCKREESYTTFNEEGRLKSTSNAPLDITSLFSDYKSLIRRNLKSSIRLEEIQSVYDSVESNENVRGLYGAKDFVYEFSELEKQFFELNEQLDFLPFYDSLLGQIESFSKDRFKSSTAEDRKILASLYTAVLTKTNGLRNGRFTNLVIDVQKYLDVAIGTIEKLNELGKTKVVNEYRDKYESELNAKIDEANTLIQKDVTPMIETRTREVNDEFEMVIEETTAKQNQTREKIQEQDAAIEKLKRNMVLRAALGSLDVFGKVLGCAGPEGKLAGAIISTGTGIAGQFIVDPDDSAAEKITVPPGIKNSVKSASEIIQERKKKKLEALKKEITQLEKSLKADSEGDDEKVTRRQDTSIAELKKKLKDAQDAENPSEELIQSIHKEMQDFVGDEKKAIESETKLTEKKKERMKKHFETATEALDVLSAGVDVYNTIRSDLQKIEKVSKAMVENKKTLKLLQEFELQIYDKLIPDFMNLHDTIETTRKSLGTKSQVSLDVQKWKIVDTIEDAKFKLLTALEGYSNEPRMKSLMDKIIAAISLTIDIYGRIQTYEESSRLANYLAQLQTSSFKNIQFSDLKLQKLYDDLMFNIQSNIIIGQYGMATTAFKQTVFPFAAKYLDDYRLPKNLMNEIDSNLTNLVQRISPNLETLKEKIRELNSSVTNQDDPNIFSAQFGSKLRTSPPFFVWSHDKYSSEIDNLLAGGSVHLFADVTEGLPLNAIKFNTINIEFIAPNETLQSRIDDILESAKITMTHLGTSYYRCGHQFYSIESPAQTITFSRKEIDGFPVVRNNVYDKLRGGNNMLSPYAVWRLKLEDADFEELSKLAGSIDIELNGRGQFVRPLTDICKTNLQQYYHLEESMTEVDDVEDVRQYDLMNAIEHLNMVLFF